MSRRRSRLGWHAHRIAAGEAGRPIRGTKQINKAPRRNRRDCGTAFLAVSTDVFSSHIAERLACSTVLVFTLCTCNVALHMQCRGNRGWHESTLLSRQPRRDHECRHLCTRLVDELCKYARKAVRCQGRRVERPSCPTITVTSPNAVGPMGRREEDPEGPESIPRPVRYPHVIFGARPTLA